MARGSFAPATVTRLLSLGHVHYRNSPVVVRRPCTSRSAVPTLATGPNPQGGEFNLVARHRGHLHLLRLRHPRRVRRLPACLHLLAASATCLLSFPGCSPIALVTVAALTGRERAALRGLCRYVIVNYLYRVEDRLRTAISTLPKDHPARLHRKGLFDGVRQLARGTATYLCTSDDYRHNKGANIHGGGQAHSSGSLDYFTAEQDGALATDPSDVTISPTAGTAQNVAVRPSKDRESARAVSVVSLARIPPHPQLPPRSHPSSRREPARVAPRRQTFSGFAGRNLRQSTSRLTKRRNRSGRPRTTRRPARRHRRPRATRRLTGCRLAASA